MRRRATTLSGESCISAAGLVALSAPLAATDNFPFVWPSMYAPDPPFHPLSSRSPLTGVGSKPPWPRLTRSSLPSLSHPFHSRGASPPTTPNGTTYLDPANLASSYPSHPQSTYHALQGGLSAPLRLGAQTGPGGYSGRVLDEKLHLNLGGGKGKEKDCSPRIFGIELKWIS